MSSIGGFELILIVLVILFLVGPEKIPGVLRSLGKGVSVFRQGIKDLRVNLDVQEDLNELKKTVADVVDDVDLINDVKSVSQEVKGIKSELKEVKTDLTASLDEVKADLKEPLVGLTDELNELKEPLVELRDEADRIKSELRATVEKSEGGE